MIITNEYVLSLLYFLHRQLKEENNNGKEKLRIMAVKNSEVMAQLTESRQVILKLESDLEDKDKILREKISLLNENRELKVRVATQNERLDVCQQEIESSRVELRRLDKIMSQLPVSMCEKENVTDVLYNRPLFYGCFIRLSFFLISLYFQLPISFLILSNSAPPSFLYLTFSCFSLSQ